MFYTIRHETRFTYDTPISESVMEARMQPRSEGAQRCIRFGLTTAPASRVRTYADHEGNIVHHFNIPGRHANLTLTAEALVEATAPSEPPERLGADAWRRVDALTASGEFWELLNASPFARPTPLLNELASEIGADRRDDPLATVRRLMSDMSGRFQYSPRSTRVDSPIDEALAARRGVCQDFTHIMIALVRQLGIPCRYVSGYLFQDGGDAIRSSEGATHAWAEALFPDIGWVGFDPTNNLIAGGRHVRVAVGRDYTDVPPTRGVYQGITAVVSELAVAVAVTHAQPAFNAEVPAFVPWQSQEALSPGDSAVQQQQQQQQQ
jgi:transglutaminase-like putative cysteine protease